MAKCPFATSAELCTLNGRATLSNVHRNILFLRKSGLVDSVRYHPSGGGKTSARHFLTADGARILSERQGQSESRTLRELPVSAEWQRTLLGRMQLLALVYQIAVQVARCGSTPGAPVSVIFPRDDALDGIIICAKGRWFGVMRQGYGLATSDFVRRLSEQSAKGIQPSTLFVVTADRFAVPLIGRQLLRRRASLTGVVSAEEDVLLAAADRPVWASPAHGADVTISTMDVVSGSGRLRDYRPAMKVAYSRASFPVPLDELPGINQAELTEFQRHTLDDVFLWPLMDIRQLAMLRGVPYTNKSRALSRLRQLGLIERIRVHGLRHGRFALSGRGLRQISRRDRTASISLLNRWQPGAGDEPTGTMLAKLTTEARHTEGVNDFAASLMNECGRDACILPSHRGFRQFAYSGGNSLVSPDLIAELSGRFPSQTLLLEYEMRATSTGLMTDKILPWLRYFSTHRPYEDFRGTLKLLFVLTNERVETTFLEVASDLCSRTGLVIPLLTTYKSLLDQQAPALAGHNWKSVNGSDQERSGAILNGWVDDSK